MSEYAVSHPMRGDLHRRVPIRGSDFPHSELPGGRVHPVDEQHAVQVVRLVLQAAGKYPGADDLDRVAAIGETAGDRVQPALHVVVDAGEGQAALVAVLLLRVGEVKYGVDEVSALVADGV